MISEKNRQIFEAAITKVERVAKENGCGDRWACALRGDLYSTEFAHFQSRLKRAKMILAESEENLIWCMK